MSRSPSPDEARRAVQEASTATGPQVVRLSDVRPERVQWLWDGYLPLGKLVMWDGDPGVGKSTLLLDIAARVSTGSPMPDGSPAKPGGILVLSAEDGLADTIRPRLDAAGADPQRVVTITEIVEATGTRPVTIPGDLDAVEAVITAHGVTLVIVDVLMAYLAAGVNAHHDQDVRRVLHRLSALAERTHCCIVAIRHLNKSGGPNAVYRGGGSIGIIGAARAGYMCGLDPTDETGTTRILAATKANLAPAPPSLAYRLVFDELHGCAGVEWLGASDQRAADLLGDPAGEDERERRTERDEAAEWLTAYLEDQGGEATPGATKAAARAAGIATRTLERARARAGVRVSRSGFPAVTVWQIAGPVSPQSRQPRQAPDDGEPGETGGETGPTVSPQSRLVRQPRHVPDSGETGGGPVPGSADEEGHDHA